MKRRFTEFEVTQFIDVNGIELMKEAVGECGDTAARGIVKDFKVFCADAYADEMCQDANTACDFVNMCAIVYCEMLNDQ